MSRRTAIVLRMVVAAANVVLWCSDAAAATCTVSTTTVNFGTYDVFSAAPTDSTGAVTYNCSLATTIRISLSKGSGSFTRRTLVGSADSLDYNLFLNAARTTVWGNGTGQTQTYSANLPPNNQNVVVTIYGRIDASQDVRAGSYTDTITITIDY